MIRVFIFAALMGAMAYVGTATGYRPPGESNKIAPNYKPVAKVCKFSIRTALKPILVKDKIPMPLNSDFAVETPIFTVYLVNSRTSPAFLSRLCSKVGAYYCSSETQGKVHEHTIPSINNKTTTILVECE
jgi:hypothetical protein